MEHPQVREPRQKRSMEKKKRIVQAGFALFAEKGFHNTNTVEIAQRAGVSTGTVYSYFQDKKAIFMDALREYVDSIWLPIHGMLGEMKPPIELADILGRIIDMSVETHTVTRAAHDEMMAMSYLDEDVREYMMNFEDQLVMAIAAQLGQLGLGLGHPREKVQIIYHMMESYCHEVLYHKHASLDYGVMRQQVIQSAVSLLSPGAGGASESASGPA